MKLDDLLKQSRKPMEDDGFTDRVMRSLPRTEALPAPQEPWFTRLLDLSALEMLVGLIAIAALSSFLPAVQVLLLHSFLSVTVLTGLGLGGGAFLLSEMELL